VSLPATHVGSLPRSQVVVSFLFVRERGAGDDHAAFDACMA
jgi:5-methyltetrahydropteroyltriglutamate--homocysteine methyltransferase